MIRDLCDFEQGRQFGGVIAIHQIGDEHIEDFLGEVRIFDQRQDLVVILVEEQIGNVLGGFGLPVRRQGRQHVDQDLRGLRFIRVAPEHLIDLVFPWLERTRRRFRDRGGDFLRWRRRQIPARWPLGGSSVAGEGEGAATACGGRAAGLLFRNESATATIPITTIARIRSVRLFMGGAAMVWKSVGSQPYHGCRLTTNIPRRADGG